jgi:TusA-related sulfurtransferase
VEIVDVRDRICSEPVVKVKTALEKRKSGETVEVLANDSAREDIERIFGKLQRNEVEVLPAGRHVRIFITKK